MNIYKTPYILVLLFVIAATSCIRDEIADCPPLRVNIAVKDKNYFNVDQVELEDRLDEDMPFRNYVPTLYWVLRDAATGMVVDESQLSAVRGDEKVVEAKIRPDVPHGKYVLTVWGGLEDTSPLGDDPTTIDFHPGNVEGNDVYLTNDTLLYDVWHYDYTVELERTKGKLIIEKLDLPEEITGSEKKVTALYSYADNAFRYSGETHVIKKSELAVAPTVVSKTMLTPSLRKDGSTLSLNFSSATADAVPSPRPIDITMSRNELTVIRYVWVPEKNDFDIYVLINSNWELITKLEIE